MPYTLCMIFIETSAFTRLVYDCMSEEDYLGLQSYLLQRPCAGSVVPGSGGVRKLRWSMEGRGKRGGSRVIYFWKQADDEIWLLALYAKNETENIPSHILRRIAEEIKND